MKKSALYEIIGALLKFQHSIQRDMKNIPFNNFTS
jgi:hypothetical protein